MEATDGDQLEPFQNQRQNSSFCRNPPFTFIELTGSFAPQLSPFGRDGSEPESGL